MGAGRLRRADDHILEFFDPVSTRYRHHSLLNFR
jgi:hypothetical protein